MRCRAWLPPLAACRTSCWFGSTHGSSPGLGGEDPTPPAADGRTPLASRAGTIAWGLHPGLTPAAGTKFTHTQRGSLGTIMWSFSTLTQKRVWISRERVEKRSNKSTGQAAVTRHRAWAEKNTVCPILYTTSSSLPFLLTPLWSYCSPSTAHTHAYRTLNLFWIIYLYWIYCFTFSKGLTNFMAFTFKIF